VRETKGYGETNSHATCGNEMRDSPLIKEN